MRIMLFIVGFCSLCLGATGYTYTWTPAATDTVTAAKVKANFDSSRVWANRVSDTINNKVATTAIGDGSMTIRVDSIAVTKRVKCAGVASSGGVSGTTITASGTVDIPTTGYADSATARAAGVPNGRLYRVGHFIYIMY